MNEENNALLNKLILRPQTDDALIVREIVEEDMFQLKQLQELLRLYPSSTALLDVGAHIGVFAAQWHVCFPEQRIYCVEPAALNFELLQKNCQGEPFSLHRCALSEMNGQGVLQLGNELFTGRWKLGSLLPEEEDAVLTDTVELRDINEFILGLNEDALVLKMDVEGAEYALIRAMNAELWQRIFVLVVEWHDQPMKEAFFNDLGLVRLFNPKSQERHAVYVRPVLHKDWARIALETQRTILSQQHQNILQKVQMEAAFTLKNLSKRLLNRLKTFCKK